jgi:transcriptional regulator with GAF, ATPase, and Fis domain
VSLLEYRICDHPGTAAIIASANADHRKWFLEQLNAHSWSAEEAWGGADALAKVEVGGCRALFLDRRLPDLDVDELVSIIQQSHPKVVVLVMDFETQEASIVEDLCSSPDARELLRFLETPHPASGAAERPISYSSFQTVQEPLPGMIGTSEAIQRVYRLARLVALRNTSILLQGETGTGKELVARAIHQISPRTDKPFVIVNCDAIPETLLESELFGFTRGAFTGALQSRLGRIHAAQGGTLLLDEVGEFPLSMQSKLLRFLQDGEVQRLGSSDVFKVDVRVIAATNANLEALMAERRFRRDLYYRLAVFPIELAPLRERPGDALLLAQHFLKSLCREAAVPVKSVSPKTVAMIESYPWPGNVRELQHAVERAFILAEEEPTLRLKHFSLLGQQEIAKKLRHETTGWHFPCDAVTRHA